MLRKATSVVTTQAVVSMGTDSCERISASSALRASDFGKIFAQKPSSKQASAGMMVSRLRNDRLPLTIIKTCSRTIIMPAVCRHTLGQKANQGAISSASQLYQTPNLSNTCGRKWNQRVNGPGMGCV